MKKFLEHFDNQLHEGFKIKEIGTRLSKEQLSYLRKRMKMLIPKTPSKSFTTLTLEEQGSHTVGKINISGPGRSFTSSKEGSDITTIFRELEKCLNDQLLVWKKSRFSKKYSSEGFSPNKEVLI
jgi:hypothetical protein